MGSIATTTLCKIGHLFMYFSSYKQGVSRLADLMATERGDPLQDAVWLLELVSETKGAEHLKLQSRRLNIFQAWLPDGYSQIFRSYVFGPSGFWTMAPLHYAAKFDPFLSLVCAHTPSTLAQSKERRGSNFANRQPCLQYLSLDVLAAFLVLMFALCKGIVVACGDCKRRSHLREKIKYD